MSEKITRRTALVTMASLPPAQATTTAVAATASQGNGAVYSSALAVESLEVPKDFISFRTNGHSAAGDRGAASFIEGDATSPGGLSDAAGRGFQILPTHDRISLRQAGIIPDDQDEASGNRTKLDALSTWCEANKIDIEVDKGTFYVAANNGAKTGWNIYPSAGTGFLRVFGHGEDSVIKRAGSATIAGSSALAWVYANANGKLTLEKFTFHGNEASCPYDAGSRFAHEQSANLRLRTAAIAGTFDALELYGMRMTSCIADGFQGAVAINRFVADDFKAWGRTRRVRSDIQFSRIPLVSCVINNFEGDAFEMEPSFTNAKHQMFLSQMLVRGALDLAGDTNFANVIASDIIALNTDGIGLNIVNFYKVKGKFKNCIFTAVDRIQRCQAEFQGGEFRLRASDTYTATASSLQIWNDSSASSVKFNRTHFCLESGVSVQTGTYVNGEVSHDDLTRSMEFNQCTTDGVLDSFLGGAFGTIAIRGGNPACTRAIIGIGGSTATKEHIYLQPTLEWSGSYLMRIPNDVFVTSAGDAVVAVSGEFASAKMLPIERWSVGSITIASGNVSPGDMATINGHTIKFVAGGATGAQVNIGATYLMTAVALVNYINSHRPKCNVQASGDRSSGIVGLTAIGAGSDGDSVTLGKSGMNISVSGANLSGGGTATMDTAITWRNTARMVVPSTPASTINGIPGLTAVLEMPRYGTVHEWRYIPARGEKGRYNGNDVWRSLPALE
ncbi:MAG: hypothetical protein E5Y67_04030 [Mesorhizobium sp.]|uniref:hypothetical protein n=1 Tax=Mesorhizobium sp. TaxID=1871066 RepID=UPI0011F9F184|nr:hypothetical protein [Mesorhizobium sp.]TIM16073.1 MAG: hypothetical protein E5Y67_04030 [Mesorhizobium sp.]